MLRLKYLFLALFLSLQGLYAQKIYVVSVGIADYKELIKLKFTENDVRTFNALMADQGAEITTLMGRQANHADIIATLRASFAKAKKEDTMVFFFSGHGYEGGFCCWEMSGSSPASSDNLATRNLRDRSKLASTYRYHGGLSYAEMQILFRNCRAGKKIVIADACFSGGLRKGNQLNTSVQSARNGDVIFFLSSRTDETSLEIPGGPNGVFTYYLAKGFLGASDTNNDNQMTMKEIFDYVYQFVVEYADKTTYPQHPVLWGRFDENMPVFKYIKKQ